jgi:hypothetical protein
VVYVVDKIVLGTGFLRALQFPLPIIIPPIAPQSPPSIIWGWYNRPVVVAVPSALSLTPLIIIIIIIIIDYDRKGSVEKKIIGRESQGA